MKFIDHLYNILLILGLISMYFAFLQYKKTHDLLTSGHRTTGEVVRLITVSSSDGNTYKPVFEYLDNQNNVIRFESFGSSNPPAYRVGEAVDIVYSEETGDRKVIGFWSLYIGTIILLCIAAPLLIIGGGYWIYNFI